MLRSLVAVQNSVSMDTEQQRKHPDRYDCETDVTTTETIITTVKLVWQGTTETRSIVTTVKLVSKPDRYDCEAGWCEVGTTTTKQQEQLNKRRASGDAMRTRTSRVIKAAVPRCVAVST